MKLTPFCKPLIYLAFKLLLLFSLCLLCYVKLSKAQK
nr:MAG TPA: hypothetical protein [Caudoviricetes sp.]